MKIEINKTYSLTIWQLINRLCGLLALAATLYHSYNNDYQKATFYAVIYLLIVVGTLKDKLDCDCEQHEEDTSN